MGIQIACNMSAPPAVNHQLNMQSAPPNVAHGHQWTSSTNNTTWHHPRQLELGPQPRHSVASSGARTDGADIIYRTAKRAPLTKYAGASYLRETDGAPVETIWSWGHPSTASSGRHVNSLSSAPLPLKKYEPAAHPHAVPHVMQDLNYIKHPCAFAGPDYGAMMPEPLHPHHYPLHLGLPDMVAPHMNPHLAGFCKPEHQMALESALHLTNGQITA